MGRFTRVFLPALLLSAAVAGGASAQSLLSTMLFDRYADALRVQAGIPGMSYVIVQNGNIAKANAFGFANVEHSAPARTDTPYQIAGLTEILTSTLILEQCEETGHLSIDDTIQRRAIAAPDPFITIRDALSHRSAAGTFKYDQNRFTALTGVVEACIQKDLTPFRQALAQKIFDRWAMIDSVPAANVGDSSADDRTEFTPTKLSQYSSALARTATPYRIVNGVPTLVVDVSNSVDAASGAISSVLDLAKFDLNLEAGDVLHRESMDEMWTPAVAANGAAMPTGLGWFVQSYNGSVVYWQFGNTPGYSSLILKVPSLRITLILLANSDGLSAGFPLQDGDVTTSLFARTFLKLFVG
jgi:CubicO group peptidase (beta-lactamase class C family)